MISKFKLTVIAAVAALSIAVPTAAMAQGFVPPPTPLPPPVFNPSSPNTVPQPRYQPIMPTTPSTTPLSHQAPFQVRLHRL